MLKRLMKMQLLLLLMHAAAASASLIGDAKSVIVSIFDSIDYHQLTRMLYDTYYMPDDNMFRFIKSEMREIALANMLPNSRYVGDNAEWETDIIHPIVQSPNEPHHKLEVKCLKGLIGNKSKKHTQGITIKNGRGKGQKISQLLKSVMKNHFILIDTKPPFSINYCDPKDLWFYTKTKCDAKKYTDIIQDPKFMDQTVAELTAYACLNDITVIKENLQDVSYPPVPYYNPVRDMLQEFSRRYTP